jgi:predicted dehydrogenase
MEKVRLGLIGYGRLGSIHARNIASATHAELFAVCDTNSDALTQAEALYGARTTPDLESFLDQPIDGVVIASNTHLHIDHIRAAARAGKHIFTEKPIGLTLEETDEALQEVADSEVQFQIGFQRRWDPRYLRAKEAIAKGEIGEPLLFKAYGRDPNASNPANWGLDKNGGLFLNAAIHDYDATRFLMDSEITRMTATGAALAYPELAEHKDIDTCTTTMFLGNRAMAMTEWSRYATYGYDIGAEVIGTDGMIQIGKGHTGPMVIRRKNEHAPGVIDEFADAYLSEVEGFATSIREQTPATPGIEDARIALHLALAARFSYENGGEAVDISPLQPLQKRRTDG